MSRTFAELKEELLTGDYALGFNQGWDERLAKFEKKRAPVYNPWSKDTEPMLFKGYTQGWQAGDEYIAEWYSHFNKKH
jgi:hypothetical protein